MSGGFLDATRQTWTFRGGWALVFAGCVALVGEVQGWWGPMDPGPRTLLILGANMINVGAFAGMMLSIRCPRCQLKVLWHAMRTQPALGWLAWLNGLEACPSCGYKPASRS